MSLSEGAVVGNYRILGKLGEGGMGAVYRGVDTMIEREVAIKALRPEIASQPDLLGRFRSEAMLLAKLNHPSIAQLYAFIQENGQSYMVMEFVAGDTLDHIIQEKGPMEWTRAAAIMTQVLDGLGHAHAAGILHRDLKPANVMLTPAGRIKLMDFGIAQALGGARMTRQGAIIGTLEYLAPERIQGKPADARSDLYAVGVMFFEMLSGKLPFQSDSEYDLLQMQIQKAPPALSSMGVNVPPDVERVMLIAMDKDPQRRYATAEEFAAALAALLPVRQSPSQIFPAMVGGSLMAGSPMAGSPMTGSLMAGPPMGGSAMTGSLMAGSPMAGSPMAGSPMGGSAMTGSPMAGPPIAVAQPRDAKPPMRRWLSMPIFWMASASALVLVAMILIITALRMHDRPTTQATVAETTQPSIYKPSDSAPVQIDTVPSAPEPAQAPPSQAAAPKESQNAPVPAPKPVRASAQETPPPQPAVRTQAPPAQAPPTQTIPAPGPAPAPPPDTPLGSIGATTPPPPAGTPLTPAPPLAPATGGIVRLSDAHSIFVAGSDGQLDGYLREEIQKQLGGRLRVAGSLADADVIMRVTVVQEEKGKGIGKVSGMFKEHAQARAVIFDAHTQHVVWQQGAAEGKVPGFRGDPNKHLAEQLVKRLRESFGR